MNISKILAVLAVTTVASGGALFAQTRLVSVGKAPITNTPTLFTIDRTTGVDTPIGPLGDAATLPFGLAVSGGVLYTFDGNTDQFRRINPLTGAYTGAPIGSGTANLNLTGEGDIAFSLDGQTGYLTTGGVGPNTIAPALYTFTLAVGNPTFVALTADTLGPLTIDGLAISPGGIFYAITQQDDQLYTLNPTTGVLTPVGGLGVAPNGGFGALTFDGSTLYGVIDEALYTINTTTGAATAVGSTAGVDFGSVSGLAVSNVPEPASAALALLGGAVLVGWRRRAVR